MKSKFNPLDSESQHKDTVVAFFNSMFKVGELAEFAKNVFQSKGLEELRSQLTSAGRGMLPVGKNTYEWFHGKPCEILSPGSKGWQKGKLRIRISLEFCPDEPEIEETPPNEQPEISEPESPLDDLRQLINQNNHQINE
ncbi:MAG TPA: KGK domain protein [Cyanobacteria bacterium UBA11372]|nr:KGK domain protein [Cyanobacteria bacterium UBA11372]